jgi:hypothetical protein
MLRSAAARGSRLPGFPSAECTLHVAVSRQHSLQAHAQQLLIENWRHDPALLELSMRAPVIEPNVDRGTEVAQAATQRFFVQGERELEDRYRGQRESLLMQPLDLAYPLVQRDEPNIRASDLCATLENAV